jgi:hypothetical protein
VVQWEYSSIRVHVTAPASSKVVSTRRTESDLESPDNHRGSMWCGRCGNGSLPGTRGRGTETSDDETCWNAAPSYALPSTFDSIHDQHHSSSPGQSSDPEPGHRLRLERRVYIYIWLENGSSTHTTRISSLLLHQTNLFSTPLTNTLH